MNFKDFIPENQFYRQWRWRIEELGVILLDHEGDLIKPPSEGIKIQVNFPTLFNDTDANKYNHTFLGRDFLCRSTYVLTGTTSFCFYCHVMSCHVMSFYFLEFQAVLYYVIACFCECYFLTWYSPLIVL